MIIVGVVVVVVGVGVLGVCISLQLQPFFLQLVSHQTTCRMKLLQTKLPFPPRQLFVHSRRKNLIATCLSLEYIAAVVIHDGILVLVLLLLMAVLLTTTVVPAETICTMLVE